MNGRTMDPENTPEEEQPSTWDIKVEAYGTVTNPEPDDTPCEGDN